jgi:ankyrin repeat protein
LYQIFIEAVEAKDAETALGMIRSHPELQSFPRDEDQDPPWFLIEHCFPALIGPALDAGLHPDAPLEKKPHTTLLQNLVCKNDLDLIKAALAHGADIEARNIEGETALGYAAAWAELPVVQLLVRAGANVNAIEESPDGFRTTALDACTNKPEIFAYLRSVGAKRVHELSQIA